MNIALQTYSSFPASFQATRITVLLNQQAGFLLTRKLEKYNLSNMFTSQQDQVNQASGSCSAAMASFPVFSDCSFMAFWTFGSLILGSKPSCSNLFRCIPLPSERSIRYKSGQVAASASRHLGCLTLSYAKALRKCHSKRYLDVTNTLQSWTFQTKLRVATALQHRATVLTIQNHVQGGQTQSLRKTGQTKAQCQMQRRSVLQLELLELLEPTEAN